MAWKSIGCGGDYGRAKALPAKCLKTKQSGELIALVGNVKKRHPSGTVRFVSDSTIST
jgi:hypothetical protein